MSRRGKRPYRIVHEGYLAEFLGITFPPGTWRANVRLGKVRQPAPHELLPGERRLIRGAFGASADAIVFLPDRIIIIEAMVRHEPGALEDLYKYRLLFRETEEFKKYANLPIELWLLTPLDLPFYEKLAEQMGVKVVKYKPAWVLEYLGTYPRRERRGKLSALEFPEER